MSKYWIVLGVALVTGCAGSQKAPGTEPGDMSSSEHQAEADKHAAEAESHQDMADTATKPAAEGMHEHEGDEHSDISEQHEDAAEATK